MKAELLNQAFDVDELLLVLEELKERADDNAIIVEGLKDIESLSNLGFSTNLVHINNGQSLIDFCSGLATKFTSVVILTDWDSKGNIISRNLQTDLRACDLRFDIMIRKRLSMILKREVKDVESIYNFMQRNYPGHLEMFLKKGQLDDLTSQTLDKGYDIDNDVDNDKDNDVDNDNDSDGISLHRDSEHKDQTVIERDPEVGT